MSSSSRRSGAKKSRTPRKQFRHFEFEALEVRSLLTVLSITPSEESGLPAGTYGTNYSETLTVSGGTAPYDFEEVELLNETGATGLTTQDVATFAAVGTLTINGTPTGIGTANLTFFVEDSEDNQPAQEPSYLITIGQATPTVSVAGTSGTYNGSAYTATDSVAGVGSQSTASPSLESVAPSLTYYSGASVTGSGSSAAPTTVGTYTVLASFAGSTDYTSGSASTTFTISQAPPSVSVTDSGGTYNGSAYTATDSVAGVGSQSTASPSLESVAPSLTYYSVQASRAQVRALLRQRWAPTPCWPASPAAPTTPPAPRAPPSRSARPRPA